MTGPLPLPLTLIITMFNMPNLPGSNLPNLNIQTPNMPSVQAPEFYAPNINAPSISSSGIQGPQFQGPQFQGPSYSGPNMPGQSYAGSSSSSSGRAGEGKHAGLWLGVLIFVWALAIISLILLGLYLTGVNVNPFNYQHYKAQEVMTGFNTAGLEISRPASYGTTGGFGSQQVPFTYIDGINFSVPSSGPTGGGGITSFSSSSEMDKAKTYLLDQAKTGAVPYRIYTRDNILVYINVSSEAKAKQYEAALQSLK